MKFALMIYFSLLSASILTTEPIVTLNGFPIQSNIMIRCNGAVLSINDERTVLCKCGCRPTYIIYEEDCGYRLYCDICINKDKDEQEIYCQSSQPN